jgi:VWFA-related protein
MKSVVSSVFSSKGHLASLPAVLSLVLCNPSFLLASMPQQDSVNLKATLVQVPVIVTDREGRFVAGLTQDDFSLFEDGKRQKVSFFGEQSQPFSAVLVLDTSNSSDARLTTVQRLATGFVHELKQGDRMMVVSFDNEVRRLTDLTSDQSELEAVIKGTESGFGKLLYEAVAQALESLRGVEGRRAVVLFSDGVDMKSIDATADGVTKLAEEVGAVVYVVKTETRWWMESQARSQQAEHSESSFPGNIDGRIPLPPDFGGPDPTPAGFPKPKAPRIEINQSPRPPVIYGDGTRIDPMHGETRDSITQNLDKLYGEADAFLLGITARTGGKVFAADNFEMTRSAFAGVADEIRNQYMLGFYPPSSRTDNRYRKLRVEVSKKDLRVRSREGYRLGG